MGITFIELIAKNGGVILYIHSSIIIDTYESFDNDICNGVICFSKKSKCFITCIYRPPSADNTKFLQLLNFITDFINMHDNLNKQNLFISGDFNFPNIPWNNLSITDISKSNTDLDNFINNHFLTQYIQENTRKNNILDLFFSNEPNFVQLVKINNINYSDHNIVKIYTTYFNDLNSDTFNKALENNNSGIDFSKLNLNSSNFPEINLEFSKINWNWIATTSIESFPDIFRKIVYSVLQKHTKSFTNNSHNNSNRYMKKRRTLNRKIYKYNKIIRYSNCNPDKRTSLINKINILKNTKKQSFLE